MLESDDSGGGLVLRVNMLRGGKLSNTRITIKSTDYSDRRTFENAIKKGVRVSVICTLGDTDIKAFLNNRIEDYFSDGGDLYKLANKIGQQNDGTYVFNNIQFTATGEVTNESETHWVANLQLGEEDAMPQPEISTPNSNALANVIKPMQKFFGSNFPHAILALGWAAATTHYQEIIKVEKRFPIVNWFGEPGSHKTVIASCGLALHGWSELGMFSRVTESALYEHLKLAGSLAQVYDDPKKDDRLDELLKALFNARPRLVRCSVFPSPLAPRPFLVMNKLLMERLQ